MMDDSRKELEQLEKKLLQDEEWFQRELDAAKRLIGQMPEQPAAPQTAAPRAAAPAKEAPVRSYGDGYGQTQSRIPEPEEAPIPKRKGIKGLLILATLETLGILGLAAYWVLVLLR